MSRFKVLILSLAVAATPLTAFAADHDGSMSNGSKSLHEMMERSTQKMPQMEMSGDVDRDFAHMMADHHRAGIEMAKIEAEHGKDKELKLLAQKIISTQKEELPILDKHAGSPH
jgi:uncharacterized protein (DUF305 family)